MAARLGARSLSSGKGSLFYVSKGQLIGCGTIALGLALTFAAAFELITGEFLPGGYHNDSAWLVSSWLLKAFREWGPYLSGLIWLVLGLCCYRMGLTILRDARRAQGRRQHSL